MKIQIDDLVREATKEEIAIIKAEQESVSLISETQAAKDAALSKLANLGLTTDDLKALGL